MANFFTLCGPSRTTYSFPENLSRTFLTTACSFPGDEKRVLKIKLVGIRSINWGEIKLFNRKTNPARIEPIMSGVPPSSLS
jgi:hypothetical protein